MRVISVSADFDEEIASVFELLSDHASFFTHGPLQCDVVVPGDPAPNGLGAVRVVRTPSFEFREEVTAFNPPHGFDYVIRRVVVRGGLPLPIVHERGWLELEPRGSGTHLRWRSRFRVAIPGLGQWLEPLIVPQFTRAFTALLARAGAQVA